MREERCCLCAAVRSTLPTWDNQRVWKIVAWLTRCCNTDHCGSADVENSTKDAEYDFDADQTWIRPSADLIFVNETAAVSADYNEEPETASVQIEQETYDAAEPPTQERVHAEPSEGHDWRHDVHSQASPLIPAPVHQSPSFFAPPQNLDHGASHYSPYIGHDTVSSESTLVTTSTFDSHRYRPPAASTSNHQAQAGRPLHSLNDLYRSYSTGCFDTLEQVRLLRHFKEEVARNLDITDPLCHFANVVPLHAQKCPVLAYALMAASARHLSQTTSFDPLIADQ